MGLTPGVVGGVPSLHVALEFTTSLLQQPSLRKQMFSVCLLSHLAIQVLYPHIILLHSTLPTLPSYYTPILP